MSKRQFWFYVDDMAGFEAAPLGSFPAVYGVDPKTVSLSIGMGNRPKIGVFAHQIVGDVALVVCEETTISIQDGRARIVT